MLHDCAIAQSHEASLLRIIVYYYYVLLTLTLTLTLTQELRD